MCIEIRAGLGVAAEMPVGVPVVKLTQPRRINGEGEAPGRRQGRGAFKRAFCTVKKRSA